MKNQLKKLSLLLLVAGAASAHADNWDNGPGYGNLPGYVDGPNRGDGYDDTDRGEVPDFDPGWGHRGRDGGRGGWDGPGRGGWGEPGRDDEPGRDGGCEQGQEYSITCESIDHRYSRCSTQTQIRDVRVQRQRSEASCVEGRTWGYDRNSIWVSDGCRATFTVSGERYGRGW